MGKIPKNIVILVCLVFCMTLLAAASDVETAKTVTEKEVVKNPYVNSRVLIEAFVVEVKLAALYKAGVGPVGQRPNSVSMEKILQCLRDEDKAKVTAGAKVAVMNGKVSTMRSNEDKNIEREIGVREDANQSVSTTKVFDSYKISTQFSAQAYVLSDSSIVVNYKYEQNTVGSVIKSDKPAGMIARHWESDDICLEAGKPSIAGAAQDEETVVFLIIVADIENK